jgi:hypothetical protein
MHKYINTVDIDRKLNHIDIEHEIYDEDYTKHVTWLFGIFKHRRTFKLSNNMSNIKEAKISGFKK